MSCHPHKCESADAVVIGGGFYGSAIAIYLAKRRGLQRVMLVEREPALFRRASYNNQARVHNGYHYPRSFTTAYRSRVNFPHFVRDWPEAIRRDFTKLYVLTRRNSRVTARQFERFCREIGAKLEPADLRLRQLFAPQLVEEVFLAEEFAFDAEHLAHWAERELMQYGIDLRLETCATAVFRGTADSLRVTLESKNGSDASVASRYIFNCTYSGLNQFGGDFSGTSTRLKQEITELALMKLPPELARLGITVMDGPFFSMMPFPSRDLHTLSHVRYTPHLHWQDRYGLNPYHKLDSYDRHTRADRMVRDVGRYIPAIRDAEHVDSLFEVKTVLAKNESDDGRPILYEKHPELPGCYSILGAKIDNIYDVLDKLERENFHV